MWMIGGYEVNKHMINCDICSEKYDDQFILCAEAKVTEGNQTTIYHLYICERCKDQHAQMEEVGDDFDRVFVEHDGMKFYF